MKNFNRRSPNGHLGSKRRELAQHAQSAHRSHAFTHTLTSTQYEGALAQQNFIFSLTQLAIAKCGLGNLMLKHGRVNG